MQWCFPFRRQQEGASAPVAAKAIGANKLKAITESTRLATRRRMLSVKANTSLVAVTNSPTRRPDHPSSEILSYFAEISPEGEETRASSLSISSTVDDQR